MSFKTGGTKTKYVMDYDRIHEEYVIYSAVESVTDIRLYKMFDADGNERDITVCAEDDCEQGRYSLIDCLYALKYGTENVGFPDWCKVVVEEMTEDEIKKIFG